MDQARKERREYNTDNISGWIFNDEELYTSACEFMKKRRGARERGLYLRWIRKAGLVGCTTPDGLRFDSHDLDYAELNGLMKTLLD